MASRAHVVGLRGGGGAARVGTPHPGTQLLSPVAFNLLRGNPQETILNSIWGCLVLRDDRIAKQETPHAGTLNPRLLEPAPKPNLSPP